MKATRQGGSSSLTTGFGLSVPGVTLPAGSVIQSATLSFTFPTASSTASESISALNAVDPGYEVYYSYSCGIFDTCYESYWVPYGYDAPAYSGTGAEYGDFTSVTSPDISATVTPSSSGTLDLMALGFGPDLASGDGLTLTGIATGDLSFGYVYSGYNSDSTTLIASTTTASPTAMLDVAYTPAPEPQSLCLLSIGLLGFAILGAVRKRRAVV